MMLNVPRPREGLGGGLPPLTTIDPDPSPLGTYETKMATHTGKHLISIVLQKNMGL